MRPVLIINPRSDVGFVEHVERLMESDIDTPAALQAVVRRAYPAAVVRARDLTGEPQTVWYVFRDGRWVHGLID